jgi:hypothetical protein
VGHMTDGGLKPAPIPEVDDQTKYYIRGGHSLSCRCEECLTTRRPTARY